VDDVAMVYAGLLPIGASDLVGTEVSFGKRSHVIDNALTDRVEGLITAVANRFTTARGVAERAVDLAGRKLGRALAASRTATTPLFGAPLDGLPALIREVTASSHGRFEPEVAEQLARNHGTAWRDVFRLLQDAPSHGETIGPSRTLGAEVLHAVREEMAQTLADCVFRRTDIGTSGHPGEAALRTCAHFMAAELGWDATRQERELETARAHFPHQCVTGSFERS